MKMNLGTIDRVIRLILAIGVSILFFTGIIPGTVGIILMVLAAVFLITAFIGFCPLYFPFGISTKNKINN